MSETTPRFGLPLLSAGQAQKEITHNEALTLLDLIAQPAVVAIGDSAPPAFPVVGQCWIVGSSPSGAWAGHAGALATWTGGGWRIIAPSEGMSAWVDADGLLARRRGGAWTIGAAIASPTGGTVIDGEARAAIGAIIAALRQHGLAAG